MKRRTFVLAAALLLAASLPVRAQMPPVVTEDGHIPSGEPGISIYVRNKHLAGMTRFSPARTILFVHGATYPASTAFDLPLGGTSFMQDLAERGFDVYLLDLPGYGHSSRPSHMDAPADANPPFELTADAVRHYGVVADMVLKRRHIPRLIVMGWSWGTTIAAGFATAAPEKTERLVLYAPVWIVQGEVASLGGGLALGAYRTVTPEAARQRWYSGLTAAQRDGLIPDGWFDIWQRTTWATDPASGTHAPPLLRAPNGVLADLRNYWMSGKSTYDPARITAPTLVVQGEWDHDTPPYMAETLFPLITHAAWKRYVQIGGGTHTIIMERNRWQLFDVVEEFLMERAPTAP